MSFDASERKETWDDEYEYPTLTGWLSYVRRVFVDDGVGFGQNTHSTNITVAF
jgi:hypothetical protein